LPRSERQSLGITSRTSVIRDLRKFKGEPDLRVQSDAMDCLAGWRSDETAELGIDRLSRATLTERTRKEGLHVLVEARA
jgi:hypothetical protein